MYIILAQAAIATYHRLGGLNNRQLFLIGGWEVQDQGASIADI